jgi:hypothetical protein
MFPRSPRRAGAFSFFALASLLAFAGGMVVAHAANLPAPIQVGVASPGGANPATGEIAVLPFLPVAGKTTGAGVLIVPDAGFSGNRIDASSLAIARWLSERGLAGFVLRRGPVSTSAETSSGEIASAIGVLRARASEFKLNVDHIGVLGLGRGAAVAADFGYQATPEAAPASNGPTAAVAGNLSGRPAFLALVWGATETATVPANAPPTFLVGSTLAGDNLSGLIDLWTKLRAARVSVDAHFFAKRDAAPEAALKDSSPVAWPEMFYAWARFQGFLTDQPRLALKGMAYLDGHPLPQGYVIFTPVDFVGAGPIVARVINSTAGSPIGEFSVPANQGPAPGRYKVTFRQNMNWWLSNSFSGPLVNARNGVTPEQAYFGHHRVLSPSIDDQRVFTKQRPADSREYTIEFKPGAPTEDLKIEVFTK